MERREFLHLLGLFSGTTLLSACGPESGQNKLISYLVPPEEGVTPGEALWFPVTCTECPAGCGLQARVREGRPVKVEGIAEHPISGGGLCIRGQASLWRLYHPQRLKGPLLRDGKGEFKPVSWEEAYERIGLVLAESRREGRQSVYLSGRTNGSLSEQINEFCADLEIERLPEFEIFGHSALRRAYGLLCRREELPHYRIAPADFVLTIGADLLETFISPVDFAGQFAVRKGQVGFHWAHAEPHISLTGVNADEHLVLAPGSEPFLLLWLLRRLSGENVLRRPLPLAIRSALPEISTAEAARRTGLPEGRLENLKASMQKAKTPLVLAGGVSTAAEEGLATALLAGLLQWGCGAIGDTVDFTRSENYTGVGSLLTLEGLAGRLAKGEIGVLVASRANPVFHAPPVLSFAERLRSAALRVGITDFLDETARELDLLLPPSHSLESWGDAEPRRGVRTLIRPVIRAMHDTRSEGDILLGLRRAGGKGDLQETYQNWVFDRWRRRYSEKELKDFAEKGFLVEDVPPAEMDIGEDAASFLRQWKPAESEPSPVLVVTPSIRRHDGRSRPLQLLGEVPDPLTTVSYGEWVSVSTGDFRRLGLKEGDGLRFVAGDWSSVLPAKVQPGLAEGVYVVQRDLLETAPPCFDSTTGEAATRLAVQVEKSAEHVKIAVLSGSPSQQGRGIVPEPVHRKEVHHKRASLYPEHEHPEHRWAMVIDLSLCIGCGACAASCYGENNVPVVGREDHLRGREMSWLRIEPFYDEAGRPEFVPMLCQHCHYAPCEPVCPVYAAYHNPEGLNIQVYNRCVGTRYCSNNCPYKVRRFNWWTHKWEKPLDRMQNPDLSVRTKGVMEKCTFCIQRIREAKDKAKDEGRRVRDGEVVTACAQSCPTGAIVFGDLRDENSRVSRLTWAQRAHRVFEELGTEPSVYYLGGVRREG